MLSLSETLRTKLLPWSQQDAAERFIIARHKMRQADIPYGVQLIPHQIPTGRVIVKNRRNYGNVRNITAKWPDDGLYELGKYVLVCVLEGYADYRLGNYKTRCGPGNFIFIPPGVPHPNGALTYVDLEKSTSCEIITFLLHPNALECWMSHSHTRGSEQNNNCLVLHEYVISSFHALMKEVFGGECNSLQVGEKILGVIFEILQREIEAGRFHPLRSADRAEQKSMSASGTDFVTHLEHYVQTNLQRPLTINAVSAAMYFSPRQFTRVVRRETGKNFNAYLAEQRIAEAKGLLRNTDFSIIAIASMVGIESHNYFRTFFKRHTGLTPTEFRSTEPKI